MFGGINKKIPYISMSKGSQEKGASASVCCEANGLSVDTNYSLGAVGYTYQCVVCQLYVVMHVNVFVL